MYAGFSFTPPTLERLVNQHKKTWVLKSSRLESIDLLRGIVMIIMALDHVRDYLHRDAFFYSPTDLSKTSVVLFFTRFITHYCAPVFVFLAGISAHLYGLKRDRRELSAYLLTRGLWLVFVEIVIITFAWTFNPAYPIINLQVIWAIGISMIVLAALIWLPWQYILMVGIAIVFGHNILDSIHVPVPGGLHIVWSLLHEPADIIIGNVDLSVRYPVLPWIGIMAIGYCAGQFFNPAYGERKRKRRLLESGIAALLLFATLRGLNIYGDASPWIAQPSALYTLLSMLNVSKYPPSLLYTLVSLGPALIFLALAEKPLTGLSSKIAVFGRVPFFYYVLHLYLIHVVAIIGVVISGIPWTAMILSDRVNRVQVLKGYGFDLRMVYVLWLLLIITLYPLCKWFDTYKRKHQSSRAYLRYL